MSRIVRRADFKLPLRRSLFVGVALLPLLAGSAASRPADDRFDILPDLHTARAGSDDVTGSLPLVPVITEVSTPLPPVIEPPTGLPAELSLVLPPQDAAEARQPAMATVPGFEDVDRQRVRAMIDLIAKGKMAEADALAADLSDGDAIRAVEWAVARHLRQKAGFRRLEAFVRNNPDFPMLDWVARRAEEALTVETHRPETVRRFFASAPPRSAHGKLALARALRADNDFAQANDLIRSAWRDHLAGRSLRASMLKDFPGVVSREDHADLAARLVYEGQASEGLAVAAGGPEGTTRILQVLAASINETGAAPAMIAQLPAALVASPHVRFARIQAARRADRILEAAELMLGAPTAIEVIADGDEWWIERRLLARKLLDLGNSAFAYRIAAGHSAEGSAMRVDAEVHAGWIALRFVGDPVRGAHHFALARAAAEAPASIARAAYWQGRAAEAQGSELCDRFYAEASQYRHTYYGQLARARLGEADLPDTEPALDVSAYEQATRGNGLRVIRLLLDIEARDLAQPLITDLARRSRSQAEIEVLGDLVTRYALPRLSVVAGKLAMQRGLFAEKHAFPTFGIPAYEPVADSAEPAIVFSIARQESEFDPRAVSHAGARGLMQLMPATARRTANRFRIPLDVNALTSDPSLNARIGAAHLGELFGEYRGSYVLSFAAYNAGGGRVKEWTSAYGDPRDPSVDVVDWIERIPITETRNYVQKILENVQIYRARLNGVWTLGINNDLARGMRPPSKQLAHQTP